MPKYRYEVWDKFEGLLTGIVDAPDEEAAIMEAMIAANERGTTMIEEVDVMEIS